MRALPARWARGRGLHKLAANGLLLDRLQEHGPTGVKARISAAIFAVLSYPKLQRALCASADFGAVLVEIQHLH
jgi:hypothetical protein